MSFGWFGQMGMPEYVYAPVIWVASLCGCLAGSLLTPATPAETLGHFYRSVRPIGWWKPVAALSSGRERDQTVSTLVANVAIAAVGLIACNLSVFFLIGHYFLPLAVTAGAVIVSVLVLYQSWYRKLPAG